MFGGVVKYDFDFVKLIFVKIKFDMNLYFIKFVFQIFQRFGPVVVQPAKIVRSDAIIEIRVSILPFYVAIF
jgi:hypothetical protein